MDRVEDEDFDIVELVHNSQRRRRRFTLWLLLLLGMVLVGMIAFWR